jgi:hypothetical protein
MRNEFKCFCSDGDEPSWRTVALSSELLVPFGGAHASGWRSVSPVGCHLQYVAAAITPHTWLLFHTPYLFLAWSEMQIWGRNWGRGQAAKTSSRRHHILFETELALGLILPPVITLLVLHCNARIDCTQVRIINSISSVSLVLSTAEVEHSGAIPPLPHISYSEMRN